MSKIEANGYVGCFVNRLRWFKRQIQLCFIVFIYMAELGFSIYFEYLLTIFIDYIYSRNRISFYVPFQIITSLGDFLKMVNVWSGLSKISELYNIKKQCNWSKSISSVIASLRHQHIWILGLISACFHIAICQIELTSDPTLEFGINTGNSDIISFMNYLKF